MVYQGGLQSCLAREYVIDLSLEDEALRPKMPEIGGLVAEPVRVGKSDKRAFYGRVGPTDIRLWWVKVSAKYR